MHCMAAKRYNTEVAIAGGGLAGIVTAHELLSAGRRVLLSTSGGRVRMPTKDLVLPKSSASSLMRTPPTSMRR